MTFRILLPITLAVIAAPAIAASPFDGTWKADIASAKLSDRPDMFLLKGGRYTCSSCVPGFTVAADGKPHPVAGHDYYDAIAIKVIDAGSVSATTMRGGKAVADTKYSVSPDGKTLSIASHRTNMATGIASSSTSVAMRVAAMPAGAHAISGSWKATAVKSASESSLMQTFKVDGDMFTLSVPTGEGYSARFDGPAVMQKNDPGKTMIKLQKLSDGHVLETDMRGGKVVQTYDMTVAPGGKMMTMIITDKRTGSADTVMFAKQ